MITGKKIVLTGANSGIGLEVLKLLVKGDNKILAVDLRTDVIDSTFDKAKVTSYVCDVSTPENVDGIFAKATEVLGDIDIFYANAGFPYYEHMDYVNWDRIDKIFKVNTYSPIYTYQKFVEYKAGKPGHFVSTISAMGQLGFPGYALYAATKFAMEGWQQCMRYELPKNIKMTNVYPVATATGFFKKGAEGTGAVIKRKPFPVQKASVVAKKAVKGIEKGKKSVHPCFAFGLAKPLFRICPPIKSIYMSNENGKLLEFLAAKDAAAKK